MAQDAGQPFRFVHPDYFDHLLDVNVVLQTFLLIYLFHDNLGCIFKCDSLAFHNVHGLPGFSNDQ